MIQVHIRPAVREDMHEVISMIKELAGFERAADQVQLRAEDLEADGFDKKAFEVLVAELKGEIVGMAFFYPRYSTWKGPTLYLEDLIVKEEFRNQGIGSRLFARVKDLSKERSAARMEWQVLDWNEGAIRFYEEQGAEFEKEWVNCKIAFK